MRREDNHITNHAQERAFARFKLKLTPTTNKELVEKIQNGEGRFVRRSGFFTSLWDIDFSGLPLRIVYDKRRKKIRTLLWRDYGGKHDDPWKIIEMERLSKPPRR